MSLLTAADPLPYEIINASGASQLVLIGDHAGGAIPARLADLGVGAEDRRRHIGWDIGIAALGEALAHRLDAVFVRGAYSRLVIDYNRDPQVPTAMPEVSDGTVVPGNIGLKEEERRQRIEEIHAPYHTTVAAELAKRKGAVLVSLHSFTPRMNGFDRPWHAGILHAGHEDAYSLRLLSLLQDRPDLVVGDNEPYRLDEKDYTVPRHAFGSGRAYVEIEVRQDLLSDEAGIRRWTDLFAQLLPAAL